VDTLIEELWESSPPNSAMTTLQTYVLQLRKLLAGAMGVPAAEVARKLLVTEVNGYSFRPDSAETDMTAFERGVRGADRTAGAGDARGAVALYRQALALWRGPVLADVQLGPVLEVHKRRLESRRLEVLEARIEAELQLGLHRVLLSELSDLVSQHPTHEPLYAQYMVALHRSGRRVQALEAFQRLRSALATELGVGPSWELLRLQQAVIAADPALEWEGVCADHGALRFLQPPQAPLSVQGA
jgi:DNA-binding SARP family transcriptional activator